MSGPYTKANIHGVNVWINRTKLEKDGEAPLTMSHHVVDGYLAFPMCFDSPSYAHAFLHKDEVMRFKEKIGTIADIQDGWTDANQIGGEG